MQPSIPLSTVLQNRYRLIKILGQGGFGRTYLAEDIGRFNELCALKELIPSQSDAQSLDKAQQLFQREASILYKIHHPQIPQFRATFEQDGRLFLVQDYVEGKTYWDLLQERLTRGTTFAEAEVLQLLQQMLPVLAHLHVRGIIHRDISPDNIILRQSDRKPVLIDFGVVRELATRFHSPTGKSIATTVGKLGYAPIEQMQTGRAYPSSDLYALAVTCIVLLTGREPPGLFDDRDFTWNWQRWAKVSPRFGEVLNRMLAHKPSDRYQSVAEVAKALQTKESPSQPAPSLSATNTIPVEERHSFPQPTPSLSEINTLAVGRPQNQVVANSKQVEPVRRRSIWERWWAITLIFIAVALIAGGSSLFLVSWWLNRDRNAQPQSFPSPLVSTPPTTTPTPTPSPQPTNFSQRLNLAPGETANIEATLTANTTATYLFSAEQGQPLTVDLAQFEGVLLTVIGPNQAPIDDRANRVTRYEGTLPTTGEYAIVLSPVQGVENDTKYQLSVRLDNLVSPSPTPTETLTPTPTPTPTVEVESITLRPGDPSSQVSASVTPLQSKRYLVNVEEGQILRVGVQQGAVALDIRSPNGELLENASKVPSWEGQVPTSGAYQIDVVAAQDRETEFILDISSNNGQQF
ncbi:serine/threonine-protein kinase [Aliterella atlantica]|uniref:non-specific serine/threonine protein kinase n=1 Tax=Aliterella atlantica CENA595 TaxID=1618023 RepID=A0A0D8ZPV4_9CYAN|nr:serine/threonine-protein kinase [Aliterella atlantica]KJH70377.1 serine/threonine protein kinase [Aliterella atlantica CENA595]